MKENYILKIHILVILDLIEITKMIDIFKELCPVRILLVTYILMHIIYHLIIIKYIFDKVTA